MKTDSVDFRQKIIEVHKREDVSIRKLGQRFGVAKSFIQIRKANGRETATVAHRRV